MVRWGGLVSVNLGDAITIGFRGSIVIGIICGLFNIDKTEMTPGSPEPRSPS